MKDHPDAIKGFLRALNKSIKDAIKDPEAAIASVKAREPLIKSDVERERFDATLADEMAHPELATVGLGDIDEARLAKSIDILVDANSLPRSPTVGEVFDRSFLPAKRELLTSVK
jgi:NitT/TauT family transport system substrate-binding protein